MNYPVVVMQDRASDYGVVVPDLPGCVSAGRTLDEALEMAREAIELHLEGLVEEGLVVPRPGAIEARRRDPAYAGGTWAIVTVQPSDLRLRSRRVNISMPERVLEAADRYAARIGETRSGLLVRAVSEYMGRSPVRRERPVARPQAAQTALDRAESTPAAPPVAAAARRRRSHSALQGGD
jgi:predicted RNase H-like HicB family nuclease